MSLIPCDACQTRDKAKLTQVTWAWMLADGSRTAWRQRLCVTCMATTVAPLYTATQEFSLTCPACGIDTSDDLDPVYATFYPEGLGKMSMELPMCPSCAVTVRGRAQTGARKLEDSPVSGEGPGARPLTNASDTWAALGIVPRDR